MSFLITKEALKILAVNNASCKVFGNKRVENLKYLTACARKEKDFDFDELVKKLPEPGIMYGSIKSFAKYLNKLSIDKETMLRFLGGQWHIDYVSEQTGIAGMKSAFGETFVNRFLFSHILIIAEIVEVCDVISARYVCNEASVEIRDLVKHPFIASELRVGQKVLLHQAMIVEIEPDQETTNILFAEQSGSKEFIEVVKKVGAIDYDKFWEMKAWTEKMIAEL